MKLDNQHISFQSCEAIKKIIKPFGEFDVGFFVYVRIYPDNSRVSLNSHAEWSTYFHNEFIDENFKEDSVFKYGCRSTTFQLWSALDNQLIRKNKKFFNISNGINMFVPGEDYTEVFAFAQQGEGENRDNFYINHLETLKQAALYFTMNAYKIMQAAEKEGVIAAEGPLPPRVIEKDAVNFSVLEKMKQGKYRLHGRFDGVSLTKREYECLCLLPVCHTTKSIAASLNIDDRTVETHLNNVKIKLQCQYKSQLVDAIAYINNTRG